MVKIRAFISKKSVPRGIDINNKEYWQPFGVTIKGNDSGGGGNDDGGGDDPQPQNEYCNIIVSTVPENATILAIDSYGNQFTDKSFRVKKGSQVTIIGYPDDSSTGYVQTTRSITSDQTQQDSLNYVLTLDAEVQTTTTVTILANVQGFVVDVYNLENVLINSGGSNVVQNVPIGSVIKLKPSKQGYVLDSSDYGSIVTEHNEKYVIGITVVQNMTITLGFVEKAAILPTISNLNDDYSATYQAQNFIIRFKSLFYKLRIYSTAQFSFATAHGNSIADPLGGQSITDVDHLNNGELDVAITAGLEENDTANNRQYVFNVVAQNEQGQVVTAETVLIQSYSGAVTHKVSITPKINGIVSNSADIVRKIEGEIIAPGQQVDLPADSYADLEVSYLGETKTARILVNADIDYKDFNFNVVNIKLGVININTAVFDLVLIKTNNVNREEIISNWDGSDVPVIRDSLFRLYGRDSSGQYSDWDSQNRTADGNAIDVDFTLIPKQKYNVTIKTYVEGNLSNVPQVYMTKNNGAAVLGRNQIFEDGDNVVVTAVCDGYSNETLQINHISQNIEHNIYFLHTVLNPTVIINTIPSDATVRMNGVIGNQQTFGDGSRVDIVVEKEGYYRYEHTILEIHDDYEDTVELLPIGASTAIITVRTWINGEESQEPTVHIRLEGESNDPSNLGRTREVALNSKVICEAEQQGFSNQVHTIDNVTQNQTVDLYFAAQPANCDLTVKTYIDNQESNTPVVEINGVVGRYQSIRRGDQVDITAELSGYNVTSADVNGVIVPYPITINSLNGNAEVHIYFVTQLPTEYIFNVDVVPSDAVVTIYDDTNNQNYVMKTKNLPAGVNAYAVIEKQGYVTQCRPTNALDQVNPGRVVMDQRRDYSVVLIPESQPDLNYRVRVIPKIDGVNVFANANLTVTINGATPDQEIDVNHNIVSLYKDLPAGTNNVRVIVTYKGDKAIRTIPTLNQDYTINDINFSSDGDNETECVLNIITSLNGVTTSEDAKSIQLDVTDLDTNQTLVGTEVGGTRVKRVKYVCVEGHTIQVVASLSGYTNSVYKIKVPITGFLFANIIGNPPSENTLKVSLNPNGPFGAQVIVDMASGGDYKEIHIQSDMNWEILEQ